MKKYLLPEQGRFYKANLHCHSTLSDGKLTPEELKEEYKNRGYSVLAYTDHDILLPHPELADEEFLPLYGYEMEINEEKAGDFANIRTCHLCMIALEPDNLRQVCWHRGKYLFGNAVNYRDKVQFYEDEPDYERSYTPECISDMMKAGREHGFFVTYNHPGWSCESYEQYVNYQHMHAMEIYNYGCSREGYYDHDCRVYDDMLRAGRRIYCIGADDNHNVHKKDSGKWDSGGAWIMIKAEKLEYRTITAALENGEFYASQGPEIYELWAEDNRIHIATSAAERIVLTAGNRRCEVRIAEDGESICEASFEIKPDSGYVRLTVIDEKGKRADTNAYFTDMICKA